VGLDATVLCTCYEDGRTTEPPVPRDRLVLGDGDLWVSSGADADIEEVEEMDEKVQEWRGSACKHPHLYYADEVIANWNWYGNFLRVLGRLGWDHFPTLEVELPVSNDGTTPPEAASEALEELAYFRSLDEVGPNTFLVDTATGRELYSRLSDEDGVFVLNRDPAVEAGVGEYAFFLRDRLTKEVLFRSKGFRQSLVGEREADWLDLASGRRFHSPLVIRVPVPRPDGRGRPDIISPEEFHVRARTLTPNDYKGIVASLERVFRASVETGNSVRWC
jgi:hypothetical protein